MSSWCYLWDSRYSVGSSTFVVTNLSGMPQSMYTTRNYLLLHCVICPTCRTPYLGRPLSLHSPHLYLSPSLSLPCILSTCYPSKNNIVPPITAPILDVSPWLYTLVTASSNICPLGSYSHRCYHVWYLFVVTHHHLSSTLNLLVVTGVIQEDQRPINAFIPRSSFLTLYQPPKIFVYVISCGPHNPRQSISEYHHDLTRNDILSR